MDSWNLSGFDEGSLKAAEKAQLKKYEDFLAGLATEIGYLHDTQGAFTNSQWDHWQAPLDFAYIPTECVDLHTLIHTDNKVFNKVLICLSAITLEANHLVQEAEHKYLPAIVFYKEAEQPSSQQARGQSVLLLSENNSSDEASRIPLTMARFLATIQDLLCFVNRAYEVVRHLLQQMSCLYALTEATRVADGLFDPTNVHLITVFQSLLRLLTVLVTLDQYLTASLPLRNDWDLYKRLVTAAKNDPRKYNVESGEIRPFEKLLMTLEGRLLDGRIFKLCLEQDFDDPTAGIMLTRNATLCKYMDNALKQLYLRIESRVDAAADTLELGEKQDFVGLCALFTMYIRVFSSHANADKRLFKELFNFTNKLPAVPLCWGKVMWFGSEFLLQCLPELGAQFLDRKGVARAHDRRSVYLQERVTLLQKEVDSLYWRIAQWIIQVDLPVAKMTALDGGYAYGGKSAEQVWKFQIDLLLRGLYYASRLRQLCECVLGLTSALQRPFSKSLTRSVCRAVELCQVIRAVYHRKAFVLVTPCLAPLLQYLSSDISSLLLAAKNRVLQASDKQQRFTQRRVDVLSAIMLAQHAVTGPVTKERLLILNIAIAVASPLCNFKEEDIIHLNNSLRKLDILAHLSAQIQTASDCSFFHTYYSQFLPLYVRELYESGGDIYRLQFMFAGLHDAIRPLMATTHSAINGAAVVDYYAEVVYQIVEQELLKPLALEVETDLRLHTHSHLLVKSGQFNPLLGSGGSGGAGQLTSSSGSAGMPVNGGITGVSQEKSRRQLIYFIRVRPLRCFHRYIHIRGYVEHYLESTFFTLTAISPSEWRTYGQLQKLAEQQLGLHIEELHLPSKTLEQGKDVLEIMRQMDVFSASYYYNLNQQEFLQMRSDSKILETVGIAHVANSIRTHGMGIMNTTVNNTYLFLKSRFFQFSEFLFDERIKGKILKELQEFKEKCLAKDNLMFPYMFAERLKRNIRKMYVYADGTDPLERYRSHITRMGNAMAFVRLIRTGCLRCCSTATSALVGLDVCDNFQELAEDFHMSNSVVASAKILDHVIESLHRVFEKEMDYFKMLVDIFAMEFRTNRNIHCRNFYILLTALTICQVEHLINAKDKINKKNKEGATFIDDGFCMGVAYILKVLNLHKEFDSLQWFQSVNDYYNSEKKKIEQQLNTPRLDEKLRQTHKLTMRRLENWQLEFHILACNLQSARTIFRADQQMTAVAATAADNTNTPDVAAATAGGTAAAPSATVTVST